MILHYDTQFTKVSDLYVDLYAYKYYKLRNLDHSQLEERCFNSLEGSLYMYKIMYKITRYIFILAIQGIQGYSTGNWF